MNNVSYSSHLEQVAVNKSPLAAPDNAPTFSGTSPEDFSNGNNAEPTPLSAQPKPSEIHHDDASLLSSYQPVNKSSIMPVHQLLF